ncbi:MAG TPA: hypothetical protein VMR75_00870 [Candidatus Saccharimonadales bacterium]|nr:hypothetical protein [Candidatus Saccharimonadales bacterium]
MSEHDSEGAASIEHLDWKPVIDPELPVSELHPLVNDLMHRIDAGEFREEILREHESWEALERKIGSKYMKEIFGNRKEDE